VKSLVQSRSEPKIIPIFGPLLLGMLLASLGLVLDAHTRRPAGADLGDIASGVAGDFGNMPTANPRRTRDQGLHRPVRRDPLSLLESGAVAYRRLVDAREKGLEMLLRGWSPEQQLEMTANAT
jgi:hypothetical protein